MNRLHLLLFVVAYLALKGNKVYAQEKPLCDVYDIAKNINNPLSHMAVAPIQNNLDIGIGSFNGSRNTLNLPIVVPFAITPKLYLISRWDQLFITQNDISSEGSSQTGFGDAVVRLFFSPVRGEGKLIWGVGPAFLIPVANENAFVSGRFGIGLTSSVLMQTNGLTYGALLNQIWSITEKEDSPNYNRFYFQPFIAYNWKRGGGIAMNIELTQDWEAKTVVAFLNPTVSGLTKLGKQYVSLAVGPRVCLTSPEGSKPDFGVRTVLTFIFPKCSD